MQTNAEVRVQRLMDERATTQKLHEDLLGSLPEGESPTESQSEQIKMYREKAVTLDTEIGDLADVIEQDRKANEASKLIRRALAGGAEGVEVEDEGIAYKSMAMFARDVILTRNSPIASRIVQRLGDESLVNSARERLELLKRTPDNTLSSDVGGLQPPQHIAQIFQVIDNSRPIVASAIRSALVRGQLTFPRVATRPIVDVQASEKTEAGNQGMVVDMETTTAATYLGGGDLSWQAINWSTPDALRLWFDLAAADYALKTERDAAGVITDNAESHGITTRLTSTPDFPTFMAAVGAGAEAVYAASARMANAVYLAPDRYWYLFGLTSTPTAIFTTVSGNQVGPLTFIPSRGLDSGTIIVGDRAGLLVAETDGAPVELNVVEPAIGGVEVGIIGAFEAVVVDEGAFSLITTAS